MPRRDVSSSINGTSSSGGRSFPWYKKKKYTYATMQIGVINQKSGKKFTFRWEWNTSACSTRNAGRRIASSFKVRKYPINNLEKCAPAFVCPLLWLAAPKSSKTSSCSTKHVQISLKILKTFPSEKVVSDAVFLLRFD